MKHHNLKAIRLLALIILMTVGISGCQRESLQNQESEPLQLEEETNQDQEEQTPQEAAQANSERHDFVLYLKHRDHPYIFSDTHSIRQDDEVFQSMTLPEYVMERLILQKGIGDLINPIPPNTKLLELVQEENVIIVNVSREFADEMTGTLADTEATIAIIVNSLITLPGIDRVVLQIEGRIPDAINGLTIRQIYDFITDYYPDK